MKNGQAYLLIPVFGIFYAIFNMQKVFKDINYVVFFATTLVQSIGISIIVKLIQHYL